MKNSKDKVIIYGLFNTNNPSIIKYVGKTIQNPKKRINDHISQSKKLLTTKDEWIQGVILNGGNINYEILEEVSKKDWYEKEKYWISKFSGLTNTSSGGQGGRGFTFNLTYEELKVWVCKNLNFIESGNEWKRYIRKNGNFGILPLDPQLSYKNRGWESWSDLLPNYVGDINKRSRFKKHYTYNQAKKYIKKLNIKTSKEWKEYLKKYKVDGRMPSAPYVVYGKIGQWISWGEFLGTNNLHNKDKIFYTYNKAKKIVKNLKLTNYTNWENYIKINGSIKGVPRHPQRYYKKNKEWVSWVDFLT